MSERSPLLRQWLLLKALCSHHYGLTVKEMATEAAVSEKTVRRDLATFFEVGFPLEETIGEHGRKTWRIKPGASQPGLSFAYDEAMALSLGRQFLEPLAGTPFWEAAQRAYRKIRASLGRDALRYLGHFAGLFHQTAVGIHDYTKKAEILDQLVLGIEDRRSVFITYQSLRATEPVTYDTYPYGFVYNRGELYLVGRAPQHDEIRHWKVDRMEAAEVTQVRFPKPEDFDLQEHLANSFGIFHGDGEIDVVIRFSPTVARYVTESTWHPSQRLTPQPDGSLLAEFRLGSTEEVKHWALSFGKEAEVREPKDLRDEIGREVSALLARYRSCELQPAQEDPI